MVKRNLHIVVLSDVHLGAYACHAKELLHYLDAIAPEVLVINGDFIDRSVQGIRKIPKLHRKVINAITKLAKSQTKVYYLSSDKEETLRIFPEFAVLGVQVRPELVLQLKGKKHWFFHGRDQSANSNTSLSKLLSNFSYRFFVNTSKAFNRWGNSTKAKLTYLDTLKEKAKHAVHITEEFERIAVSLAEQRGYDAVICGLIHEPAIKEIKNGDQVIQYLNTGDWVENLTALEYRFGKWSIYKYDELDYNMVNPKLRVRSKNTKRAKSDLDIQAGSNSPIPAKSPISKALKQNLKTN